MVWCPIGASFSFPAAVLYVRYNFLHLAVFVCHFLHRAGKKGYWLMLHLTLKLGEKVGIERSTKPKITPSCEN